MSKIVPTGELVWSAIQSRDEKKVQQALVGLSKAGKTIDSPIVNHYNALGLAFANGYIDMVKYLVDAKANPFHRDHNNYNILHYAMRWFREQYIEDEEKCVRLRNIFSIGAETCVIERNRMGNRPSDMARLVMDTVPNRSIGRSVVETLEEMEKEVFWVYRIEILTVIPVKGLVEMIVDYLTEDIETVHV